MQNHIDTMDLLWLLGTPKWFRPFCSTFKTACGAIWETNLLFLKTATMEQAKIFLCLSCAQPLSKDTDFLSDCNSDSLQMYEECQLDWNKRSCRWLIVSRLLHLYWGKEVKQTTGSNLNILHFLNHNQQQSHNKVGASQAFVSGIQHWKVQIKFMSILYF